MFKLKRPGVKPPPKTIQVIIHPHDGIDERMAIESLQKIADEFNATELLLLTKKMETKGMQEKVRSFLTKP